MLWYHALEFDWSIGQPRLHPKLLRSFFHAAELEVWLVTLRFKDQQVL
ncbi:MAG: hypothetical protein K8S55_12260 [Phycisphaerae bacterium]|nr:hypothetical protein [Phycisphaerae bacterium]